MIRASSGRARPAGLGLLVALILLMWFALKWLRGGDHPLAAVPSFDLCARLGAPAWRELPVTHGEPRREIPGFGSTRGSSCYVPLEPTEHEDQAQRYVWILVTTHHALAAEGNRAGTGKMVEIWLEEMRASGSRVEPLKGPWRAGGRITPRGANPELQVLADDDGVALWVAARGLDAPALAAFAAAAARRLRKAD